MVEEEQTKKKNGDMPATAAQTELIEQLYTETKHPIRFNRHQLDQLTKDEAARAIDVLKDYKRHKAAAQYSAKKVNGFSEASFGMVYKLCWRLWQEKADMCRAENNWFRAWVHNEYTRFKEIHSFVKKEIEKEGSP